MNLEERVELLEKRVADLEAQVQSQHTVNIKLASNTYTNDLVIEHNHKRNRVGLVW